MRRRGERSAARWFALGTGTPEREELRLGMDAELLEDRAEVISDGAPAQVHLGGDGGHTVALDQARGDLPLARRQLRRCWDPEGGGRLHQGSEDARGLDLGRDATKMPGELARAAGLLRLRLG